MDGFQYYAILKILANHIPTVGIYFSLAKADGCLSAFLFIIFLFLLLVVGCGNGNCL